MHHLSKDVRAELRYVLIGEIVCSALICVVFALLHRLDYTVPLGAVWGSFFALLNLYLLARRVQRISDSGEADKAAAQKQLKARCAPPARAEMIQRKRGNPDGSRYSRCTSIL